MSKSNNATDNHHGIDERLIFINDKHSDVSEQQQNTSLPHVFASHSRRNSANINYSSSIPLRRPLVSLDPTSLLGYHTINNNNNLYDQQELHNNTTDSSSSSSSTLYASTLNVQPKRRTSITIDHTALLGIGNPDIDPLGLKNKDHHKFHSHSSSSSSSSPQPEAFFPKLDKEMRNIEMPLPSPNRPKLVIRRKSLLLADSIPFDNKFDKSDNNNNNNKNNVNNSNSTNTSHSINSLHQSSQSSTRSSSEYTSPEHHHQTTATAAGTMPITNHLEPEEYVSQATRQRTQRKSMIIQAKNEVVREEGIEEILIKRKIKEMGNKTNKEERFEKWSEKTKLSPFGVDLESAVERRFVMAKLKLKKGKQQKLTQMSGSRARNRSELRDTLEKAVPDLSNIEVLRREKRAIVEEEKRLKALLSLEQDNVVINKGTEKRLAEIANRNRQQAKLESRRNLFKNTLDMILQEEVLALKFKHGMNIQDIATERKSALPEFVVPVVKSKRMTA